MPQFECLFFLENPLFYILEIKRTDLSEDVNMNEKFKWLRINKDTLAINELNFSAMDSSEEIEERYFQEGYLKFNSTTGTFIEKYNSAQHSLDRIIDFKLQDSVQNTISAFLPNLY